MYYYIIAISVDNPILLDLSRRKLTIYTSAWVDSYFVFRQYAMKVLEHRKDFYNQEIHTGCTETKKQLEEVMTTRYKLEDFDSFYRLSKIKIHCTRDHTRYTIATLGRYNYLKVKIKRELPRVVAEAITRMLLSTMFAKRFCKQHSVIQQMRDFIQQIHPIIYALTVDDIDQIYYLLNMVKHGSCIMDDPFEL